ncbi:MAG: ABC transporter permease [Saprospiraceae bacterium]|nr:ABC transporter permease [Saprospiraceae bacterium]
MEPTETQKAWRRFRRNLPAFAGLWFIAFCVFTALFAYVLAPDQAPDANTQIPELALAEIGAKATLIALPAASDTEPVSWLQGLWSGYPVGGRLVPVEGSSIHQHGDSTRFEYVGTHTKGAVFGQAKALIKNRSFPLGTDKYGRCIWSRLLLGFRVSLVIGLIAVFISLTIGLLIGLLGGYFGGRLDDLVMLLVNTVWSIPTLLLVFAVVLALGRGIGIIFLAVGLTMWVDVARIVRGQTLAIRALPFVEAAASMGFSHFRIIFKHVLPNLVGPILVVASGNFATAILIESGLSYLGFGVQAPTPSWGSMMHENYGYALSGKPMLALAPAIAIALTVLAFNLVGNGLRDALDIKR